MTAYERLVNAIIIQAVKDWRSGDERDKAEIERFFRSPWFGCLTRLDPAVLITNLRKEIS